MTKILLSLLFMKTLIEQLNRIKYYSYKLWEFIKQAHISTYKIAYFEWLKNIN